MSSGTKALKYTVRLLAETEIQDWDIFIDEAYNGTIFHKFGWLQAAAKQSNTKLIPLVCEKSGSDIVAVFPLFLLKKFFLNILFSPPPGCAIPYLGPVFRFQSDKQARIEADQYHTIEAYDNYIHSYLRTDYLNVQTNMYDVRPYKWLNYKTEPLYTYRLCLDRSLDELFVNFEKNIRNKVKKIKKSGKVETKTADNKHVDILIDDINQRYKKLRRSFKPSTEYIRELLSHYGEKELQLRSCNYNDKYQTSFLTINYKKDIKFWLGGVSKEQIENGINEYIHWHLIQEAANKGHNYYERIGANTKHLCSHKSRYGFRPEVYYKVEKWSRIGNIFFGVYTRLRKTTGN